MKNTDVINIKIKGLKKKYADFTLNIPNLNIRQGEIIGLIGKNGAGKSTFLKILLNIVQQDEGSIKINNSDTINISMKEYIGVAFDSCYFPGMLTVSDINKILKNVYINTWNEKQFFEHVKKFELPLDKSIETFSHGMKAKLSIIVALSHNPKLLILDEATSNLDPVTRVEINEVIKSYVKRTRCTLIFSSHLINDLEKVADRIVLLKKGEIELIMTLDDIQKKYYIIEVDSSEKIPVDTCKIIKKENGYIGCLISSKETLPEAKISIEELMYYLDKGEEI